MTDTERLGEGMIPPTIGWLIDRLPRERQWDEYELAEWLELCEGGLRVFYRLPRRRAASLAVPPPADRGDERAMTR